MASCSGASIPILTRRPVPPSNVIWIGPLANSCAMVMFASTPSAGWITIDSSARRLRTSIDSSSGYGAQRLGKGLALRVVGDRRAAAHDVDQLTDLMLTHMNDVAVDFIGVAAPCHELHELAPSLNDRGGNSGVRGAR